MADTPKVQSLDDVLRWLDKPGAVFRLRSAVQRFQAHTGPLQPHFAYGALSHSDFALAHALHIANHQDEIAMA